MHTGPLVGWGPGDFARVLGVRWPRSQADVGGLVRVVAPHLRPPRCRRALLSRRLRPWLRLPVGVLRVLVLGLPLRPRLLRVVSTARPRRRPGRWPRPRRRRVRAGVALVVRALVMVLEVRLAAWPRPSRVTSFPCRPRPLSCFVLVFSWQLVFVPCAASVFLRLRWVASG